ncbi:putative Zinc finger, PHD-type, Zinc finger, FYVE/PHD-type, Zinc finger, RING/FYVE/PHD-type [Plasmopara halstedii]
MASAQDARPSDPCCICMSLDDDQGTLLVQCVCCAIRVHIKCYGVSIVDGDTSSWLCQACESAASDPSPRPKPQCAVCPIAGGALRLTDQCDVWCHVLCLNWIPELYHSLTGAMDEAVQIALLDKSRSTLRCLICGLRGGCIQCVSGRCAKAFHVLCAFRAPSSILFTGYNLQNQQVYHCRTHLSDVDSTKFEMVDNSWRTLPEVQQYVDAHPKTSEPKCRFCGNKVTLPNKDAHETQCLLGWKARSDAHKRKQELHRLGAKAAEISYVLHDKSPGKKRGGKTNGSSSPEARKDLRNGHGKWKRQEASMRPCPECKEEIKQTLMMGHLRNSCPKRRKAMKRKMPHRNGLHEDIEGTDMTDVLFASWPGQSSGAPMDSTHFWKVVDRHFYNSSILEKKRMGQLSKNLCGVRLEDLAKAARRRPLQASDIHCRDTIRLEREAEDPSQTLMLKKCTHKCDFLMRTSHCRCLSDPLAEPMIAIRPYFKCNQVIESDTAVVLDGAEATMWVRFMNGENKIINCKYSMRVARDAELMNRHAAENGTFATTFQHDAVSTLTGFDMQTKRAPLANENKLLISLDTCSEVKEALPNNDPETSPQELPIDIFSNNSPMTDEFTPAINLLMEHHKDTTEQNRYCIRMLYKKLQIEESQNSKFRLLSQMTDSYYTEFAAWKRLCLSLVSGFTFGEENNSYHVDSDEQEELTEDEDDTVDDGTCVVCFDGQSPETNPIIFCDRCELAVHQRCYGMAKVPSSEFICDRCRSTHEGHDPAIDVFCQLCSLGDGAFKRTVDGKWVHIVCALWCPKVWIGNLSELSEISLVGPLNQARFINPVEDIDAKFAQALGRSHICSRHDEVHTLELGSLCVHCRVACGRTIQCCHQGCSTSFHPLCGWFDGLPMTISLRDERYMYAGGGAGLHFQLFCSNHLPKDYSTSDQTTMRRRRARFRIDSYFVMRNKVNFSSAANKNADDESSLLSGSIVQAVLSAEKKACGTGVNSTATDWTDMTVCSACFEYCAPIVGMLTDVNMLHRRQFMIRCQYCNIYIHPECCISDIGSSASIFQSNWICERCTQTGGIDVPGCIVCAKVTDYLMPCVNPAVATTLSNGKNPSGLKITWNGEQHSWLHAHQSIQQQQQNSIDVNRSSIAFQPRAQESVGMTSKPAESRWIHVYCGKWQKVKTVKRHHMLCAYASTFKLDGAASRCELCDKREGVLASCTYCHRRFHPICAAQKKLYCARSNRTEWKFYCENHPPPDAAFDSNRQSWITQEILGQLQDLRRSLERGRMLLEMARQRDRQHKRLLNLCKLPLMETSIEVVLKKRPSPQMKEIYHDLTGEVLTDVPHRPNAPRNSRSRVKTSQRVVGDDRTSNVAKEFATPPERRLKRQRTRSDSNESIHSDHNARRSSRRKSIRFNQESFIYEGKASEEDDLEAFETIWTNLVVPQKFDAFDFVVAKHFPELMVHNSTVTEMATLFFRIFLVLCWYGGLFNMMEQNFNCKDVRHIATRINERYCITTYGSRTTCCELHDSICGY